MLGLASLPDEILKLVMQHVPLKERLTSCCLVSSKLHAAAVAATQELRLCCGAWKPAGFLSVENQHHDHVMEWLFQHGQYVTCLDMLGFVDQPLQQLPCPNIEDLRLDACGPLRLISADGQLGVSTKLTRLDIFGGGIMDTPAGAVLDCLSSLVHLHLHVSTSADGDEENYVGGLSSATLPHLTLLTFLDVLCLSVENLQQLGALTNLQELHLKADCTAAVGPGSVPGFTFPTSLTWLKLASTTHWLDEVQSKVEAGILSVLPTGLLHFDIECPVEGPIDGPGSFLCGMARLRHLTELSVHTQNGMSWPAVGPAYSALTASSKLCSLTIIEPKLPRGVWSYVFPATRRMPHLTSLHVNRWSDWGAAVLPSAWGAADLSSLVSSCPNLFIIYHISLQHGVHVSELHKLSALNWLEVSYCEDSLPAFEGSLKGMAAVTRLRHLKLSLDSTGLTVVPLLPLTNLTALTAFQCRLPPGAGWQLQYTSTTVGPFPDVWLQLLERCAADPACQPTALRSMAQQLGEHRHLQQMMGQLIEGSGRQQQQQQWMVNCAQQQQVSALQQVVAEQGGRIAALESQLQQLHAELQQLRQQRPQ